MTKLKIEVTANPVKVGEAEFMRDHGTEDTIKSTADWVRIHPAGKHVVVRGRIYRAAVAP